MKMLEDKLSHMESIRIRQQEQQQQQLFATNTAVEYDPAKDPNRVF
jgi:hypothetical protein